MSTWLLVYTLMSSDGFQQKIMEFDTLEQCVDVGKELSKQSKSLSKQWAGVETKDTYKCLNIKG